MEYKSASTSNTQSWYFTDLDDSRFNIVPATAVGNNVNMVLSDALSELEGININRKFSVGEGLITENNERMVGFEIHTTSTYDDTKIILDHDKAKAQGFLMQPTDWTNFEITGYFEFVNTSINSKIEIYGRSGRHINGRSCEGMKYSTIVTADGKINLNIKHWHSGGIEPLSSLAALGDVEGRRIGIKFIVYNNKNLATIATAAKLEVMVDLLDDNNWEKIYDFTDVGQNTKFLKCGSSATKVITWGGPIVGVNVFNFPNNGLNIDKLSVREIDAIAPKFVIPTPPAPIDPEAVSAPTAPPSTGYRTDMTADDWDDDVTYPLPTYRGE